MESSESSKGANSTPIGHSTTAESTKELSQSGRIPRLSGIGRPSRAPATRRDNDARQPTSSQQKQQQTTVLSADNSGEAVFAEASIRESPGSTTQRLSANSASAAVKDVFTYGPTQGGASRPRQNNHNETDVGTKQGASIHLSPSAADSRGAFVEDGVTNLIALEDVDIPTESEGDDELSEVQSWLRQPIHTSSSVNCRSQSDKVCSSTKISRRNVNSARTKLSDVDKTSESRTSAMEDGRQPSPATVVDDAKDRAAAVHQKLPPTRDSSDDGNWPPEERLRRRQKRTGGCVRRWCCTVLYLLFVVAGVSLAAVKHELITRLVQGYLNVDTVGELGNMRRELSLLKEALTAVISGDRRKMTKSVDEPNNCSGNFTFHSAANACYAVVFDKKEWVNADLTCKRLHKNAHLVFIDNEDEQSAVQSLLESRSDKECLTRDRKSGLFFWIGGQRLNPLYESTVVWKTLSGSAATGFSSEVIKELTYSNWKSGEPNYDQWPGPSPEACVSLNTATGGDWSDERCSRKFCFVCEVDVHETSFDSASSRV